MSTFKKNINMTGRNRIYEIESYCLFQNIDESILKLNPIIEIDKYEFVEYSLKELEEKFHKLFSFSKKISDYYDTVKLGDDIISSRFYDILEYHPLGGSSLIQKKKIYFLKKKENFTRQVKNGIVFSEMQEYKSNLIQKLRYFKNGDILSPIQFEMSTENQHIETKLTNIFHKPITNNIYSISDSDIDALKKHISKEFKSCNLTRTAELYFNKTYELDEWNLKFTNFFIALESLFNRGKDQISHIVSRHLALIVSKSSEEFDFNYKNIKKLYGLRSKIVHGQKLKLKEADKNALNDLQNLTRQAIIYCMESSKESPEELFNYLNSKGFQ